MEIEYPDNVKLSSEEVFAVKFHDELDKKDGYTDRSRWPKWLVAKMEKATNNPLKGGD